MEVRSWEGVMGVTAERFNVEEVGIAVFAEAFPLEKIREILKATGREGKRKRQLPATMMVYYVIALGLFVSVGCREVLRRLLADRRASSGAGRSRWCLYRRRRRSRCRRGGRGCTPRSPALPR